jgi:uncharacterized alkaline shock family protein YloU
MATTTETRDKSTDAAGGESRTRDLVHAGGRLESDRGATTIASSVVAKVVGIAAREVQGVYEMGGAPARAIGSVTQRVGLSDQRAQGVSVEVGTREAAADLTVVVEYGESIPRVASEVRENVVRRVEGICGLDVTEVNVEVNDLHFPGDEDADGPRVQ